MEVVTTTEAQPTETPAPSVRFTPPRRLAALATWLASPLHLYLVLLALMPLGMVVLFVLDRGYNMPYLDQWENSVLIAVKGASGTLTPADIVRQNFDHRLVFANLITLALTYTTHWNLIVEMFLVVAVAIVNWLLLTALFRLHNAGALAAVLVPFSLLIFAIRANTIWIWSMLISTPLIIMFLLLALYLLKRYPVGWKPLIGASLCSICMSLCLLQGFIAWPLLLVALWMFGYRKPAHFAFWLVVAGITSALYFSNYDFSLLGANEEGNSAGLVLDAGRLVGYSLAYLGNPFAMSFGEWRYLSTAMAIVGLVLGALNLSFLWLRSRSLRDITAWVVLALWACGSALLTAFGRGHVYPDVFPHQPMIDRYVPPPSMFWAAFVAVAVLVLWRVMHGDRTLWSRLLMLLNVILLAVMVPIYAYVNLSTLNRPPAITDATVECMVDFPTERNTKCLALTYLKQTPLIDLIDRINEMSRYQLAAFAGRTPVYTEVIPLYRVDRASGEGSDAGFRFFEPTPDRQYIAFQQRTPVPTEFAVSVPDSEQSVVLAGAVTREVEDGDAPANGILTFRIGIRSLVHGDNVIGEVVYNPREDRGLKPFRIDLNTYRGEDVRIILQAVRQDGVPTNLPLWIDPLVFVATE